MSGTEGKTEECPCPQSSISPQSSMAVSPESSKSSVLNPQSLWTRRAPWLPDSAAPPHCLATLAHPLDPAAQLALQSQILRALNRRQEAREITLLLLRDGNALAVHRHDLIEQRRDALLVRGY